MAQLCNDLKFFITYIEMTNEMQLFTRIFYSIVY